MSAVLLIEDEEDLAFPLERLLVRARVGTVRRASSGGEALALAAQEVFDVALLDLGLPDGDGLELLPRLVALDPHLRVVVLTGRPDARLVVKSLKAGAVDYLVKPFETEELVLTVQRLIEEASLRREVEGSRRARTLDAACVGDSPAWRRALDELRAAAASSRAPVLILGESGSGKDVTASLVHKWSPRADGPFVAVNAACLPASTLDSELFGHEAGAFTDARTSRRGLFELAHGGTLFLDEIGELPLELQPKLLRVLEGLPFRRLGGEREIRTDVRVVAATNRDLALMVAAGTFREDLYFRLRVLSTTLPPLRERRGDVRLLALHFLQRHLSPEQPAQQLSTSALAALEAHPWPGNVRELRNVLERAQVLAGGGTVDVHHLPAEIRGDASTSRPPGLSSSPPPPFGYYSYPPSIGPMTPTPPPLAADATLDEVISRHVLATWDRHNHNVTRAARALGIGRVALRRRLLELNARPPPGPDHVGHPGVID